MQTFVTLLKESTLIQGAIALLAVGGAVYLMTQGQPVPELLSTVVTLVLGFYFGQKAQQSIAKK